MERSEFLFVFVGGALFGAATVLMVAVDGHSQSPSSLPNNTSVQPNSNNTSTAVPDVSTEVSFEQLNNTYREIGFDTREGDRVLCTVSRLDEVQISRTSYVYRNTSCESWIDVNGSTTTVPVDAEFLFSDGSEFRVGFDFDEEYVVCSVSEETLKKTGEGSYVYRDAGCESVRGGLYEEWNDSEFENFDVHERGRGLLENR